MRTEKEANSILIDESVAVDRAKELISSKKCAGLIEASLRALGEQRGRACNAESLGGHQRDSWKRIVAALEGKS